MKVQRVMVLAEGDKGNKQFATVRAACAMLPSEEWRSVPPDSLIVTVLSGAMTNAVFLCRVPGGKAVIVRIFGETGELIDRNVEMAVFNELAQTNVGPGMLAVIYADGTVGKLDQHGNQKTPIGRIEEYLDGWTTLSWDHYQSKDGMSPHIASVFAKLAQCHKTEVACVPRQARIFNDLQVQAGLVVAGAADVGAERWESLVTSPLDIAAVSSALIEELRSIPLGDGELGFCHNDLQHGNVMMLESSRQYILIDFEYAGYNPIYYDIANIWCEIPANYSANISSVGFLQDFASSFPTPAIQLATAASYLSTKTGRVLSPDCAEATEFVQRTHPWVRASHLFWGLWGILQARERRNETLMPGDFDYAAYAANRLNALTLLAKP